MTEPINIPIEMGIKPKATLNLTNTVTGEVQTMSMGAPEGMILDHYLDWAMQQGLGLLGTTTFDRCYLGTGNTPVQPTDTGLSGSQLAMSSESVWTKALTGVNQKFEHLNTIEGLGISNTNQLAVTPDESILLVGVYSETFPGLRAFLIDKENWTLSLLEVPDFEELENPICQALSCGGDYLFVGLNQSPWGKLYKRVGNDFSFLSNIPGLSRTPTKSNISGNGTFLVVNSTVYRVDENDEEIIKEITSFGAITTGGSGFIDNETFFQVHYDYDSSFFRIYSLSTEGSAVLYEHNPGIGDYRQWYDGVFIDGKIFVACLDSWEKCTRIYSQDENGVWGVKTVDTIFTHKQGAKAMPSANLIIPVGNSIVYMYPPYPSYSAVTSDVTVSNHASMAILDSDGVVMLRLTTSPTSLGIFKLRDQMRDKQSYARKWTFPAGTGTGVVNEIAIQATSGTGANGNNRYFLRFVLPEGFEKTDLHQLEVEVEAEIENPGVWEGTIPGGSRDGSDVSYRITMSENQFRDFITTGYNNLSTWFGTSGTPNVRIGTGNEDTDLVLDRENIRGHEIEYIYSSAIREVIPYVPGSLERTIRLFLEINQGNGKIGEIVFGNRFCRVTFNPPLNKYDPEGVDAGRDPSTRLYMNLVFGWKREGE